MKFNFICGIISFVFSQLFFKYRPWKCHYWIQRCSQKQARTSKYGRNDCFLYLEIRGFFGLRIWFFLSYYNILSYKWLKTSLINLYCNLLSCVIYEKTRLSYVFLPFRSLDEIHQMRRSRSPTRHHDASRTPVDYRSRDMDSQYLSDQERYIVSLNLEKSLEMSLSNFQVFSRNVAGSNGEGRETILADKSSVMVALSVALLR